MRRRGAFREADRRWLRCMASPLDQAYVGFCGRDKRVSVDRVSVTEASDEYGVSRPTFYQARADFDGAGQAGLVPRKRGPHKLQGEVLAFLIAQVDPGEPIRARELTECLGKSSASTSTPERPSARSVKKTA